VEGKGERKGEKGKGGKGGGREEEGKTLWICLRPPGKIS